MPVVITPLRFHPFGFELPVPAGGTPVIVGEAPVAALPTLEEVWSFTRFRLTLPVALKERELPLSETNSSQIYRFANGAERNNWVNATGGFVQVETREQLISQNAPYEKFVINRSRNVGATEPEGVQFESLSVQRTILPIDVTMGVQLLGSEGILWSSSLEIPVRYAGVGAPGTFLGTGEADEYTDLINAITVLSGQPLRVRLTVRVPAPVATFFFFGVAVKNAIGEESPAAISLYYDPLPRSDYPLKRGGAR